MKPKKVINIPSWLFRIIPKVLIPIFFIPRFVRGFVHMYNDQRGIFETGDVFNYKYELNLKITYVRRK